ncbi:nesp006 [Neophasia sp. alphabaculovirus]|nr:nesp006 [Neophasia sp. alphabaculovirus]
MFKNKIYEFIYICKTNVLFQAGEGQVYSSYKYKQRNLEITVRFDSVLLTRLKRLKHV